MKKSLFISDLHLDSAHPAIAKLFMHLLEKAGTDVDGIYILGDLFEFWVGDDDQSDFNRSIINALKSTTEKGIPVYLLHGNRDFLLGKKFIAATGCQLLPDESVVTIYNTPVLLMHGDTLCTRDLVYLKSRKWIRNHFIQTLFLLMPLRLRQFLAAKMREKSQQYVTSTPIDIMDVTHSEVVKVMQKHRVAFLIHGHTHRLGMHQFTLESMPAMRIVLGAWHHHGSVLEWNEDGGKSLLTLDRRPE